MKVVITGGAGFVGKRLAEAVLKRGRLTYSSGAERPVERLVLVDTVAAAGPTDSRVEAVTGDIADAAAMRATIDGADVIFHLAAVVSGHAEAEFDTGMRVNLDGTRAVLEAARAQGSRPRVVFSSSVAVFGGALPDPVPDHIELMPQTYYGAQKAMGELLVCDYTRKGFIEGCALRLPTVVVRPGRPNKAAISFASGIIREPLAGVAAQVPVDPATVMWLSSPDTMVDNLLHAAALPAEAWEGGHRALCLPGLAVSVREMIAALERVAGPEPLKHLDYRIDPVITRIVATWPGRFDDARARRLGFAADRDFDGIVRAYMAQEGLA